MASPAPFLSTLTIGSIVLLVVPAISSGADETNQRSRPGAGAHQGETIDLVVAAFDEHVAQSPDGRAPFTFDRSHFEGSPSERAALPIGVFDSGIGGLTVLEALLTADAFDNETLKPGPDGRPDFEGERFLYLGDQANMPYGNYPKAGKTSYLRELILKDIAFLLGTRHRDDAGAEPRFDKSPVKAVVIACNTATAYGLEDIRAAMKRWGIPVPVVGVVEAGARGLLQEKETPDEAIGVLATVGTCASEVYPKTIQSTLGRAGRGVAVITQHGSADLAAIIEGEPGLEKSLGAQIDADVRDLVEAHRDSRKGKSPAPLGTIVLGCTHFPLVQAGIETAFAMLRRDPDLAPWVAGSRTYIDPAAWTARQLFQELARNRIRAPGAEKPATMRDTFYLSVPNPASRKTVLSRGGGLDHDYKYGRDIGDLSIEDTVVVPLTRAALTPSGRRLVRDNLPQTWSRLPVGETNDASPYGVCAHLARGDEHDTAREEIALMRQAGIGWARADFSWTGVQGQDRAWHFENLDETVAWAGDGGVKLLPILNYDTPWASPAYRHLDLWLDYVRHVVNRYKDRLRYWEVWNEPNLKNFWRETPDPAAYTTLLKATCQEIKKIDPDLVVLLGGMAGVPWEFIEGIYEAGGGAFFDVMNVHPYQYPRSPEQPLVDNLHKLRELMARHGDGDKPIWITEIGWPTHQALGGAGKDVHTGIIRAAMSIAQPGRKHFKIIVLDDAGTPFKAMLDDQAYARCVPGEAEVSRAGLADLSAALAGDARLLILPLGEFVPTAEFGAIEDFLKRGGAVVVWGGAPMFYGHELDPEGGWNRRHLGDEYRCRVRLGFEAHWTDKKIAIPENTRDLFPAEAAKGLFELPKPKPEADRFLKPGQLRGQDRFIPLLQARAGDYTGTVAAVIDYDSDWKGALIVNTLRADVRGVTPEQQASILPRSVILALENGVSRFFWYEFQAPEHQANYNEHHFGIVHRDLSPKPAYIAYQTLTRLRPPGSKALPAVVPVDPNGEGPRAHGWTRPDGTRVWAVWNPVEGQRVEVIIEGKITGAVDHLGHKIDVKLDAAAWRTSLPAGPIYLSGPEAVKFRE